MKDRDFTLMLIRIGRTVAGTNPGAALQGAGNSPAPVLLHAPAEEVELSPALIIFSVQGSPLPR